MKTFAEYLVEFAEIEKVTKKSRQNNKYASATIEGRRAVKKEDMLVQKDTANKDKKIQNKKAVLGEGETHAMPEYIRVDIGQAWQSRVGKAITKICGPNSIVAQGYSAGSTQWTVLVDNSDIQLFLHEFENRLRGVLSYGGWLQISAFSYDDEDDGNYENEDEDF